MTNKEAIEKLEQEQAEFNEKWVDFSFDIYYRYCSVNDAYNRAIKALEFIEENYPKTFEDYLKGEEIW